MLINYILLINQIKNRIIFVDIVDIGKWMRRKKVCYFAK